VRDARLVAAGQVRLRHLQLGPRLPPQPGGRRRPLSFPSTIAAGELTDAPAVDGRRLGHHQRPVSARQLLERSDPIRPLICFFFFLSLSGVRT
jgi:hypothetical protein